MASWLELPEIIGEVAKCLSGPQVLMLGQVSRNFRAALSLDHFWEWLLLHHFGIKNHQEWIHSEAKTPKQIYFHYGHLRPQACILRAVGYKREWEYDDGYGVQQLFATRALENGFASASGMTRNVDIVITPDTAPVAVARVIRLRQPSAFYSDPVDACLLFLSDTPFDDATLEKYKAYNDLPEEDFEALVERTQVPGAEGYVCAMKTKPGAKPPVAGLALPTVGFYRINAHLKNANNRWVDAVIPPTQFKFALLKLLWSTGPSNIDVMRFLIFGANPHQFQWPIFIGTKEELEQPPQPTSTVSEMPLLDLKKPLDQSFHDMTVEEVREAYAYVYK